MKVQILILLMTVPFILADEGDAITTRYWDCCKPSCGWPGNVPGGYSPVNICSKSGSVTGSNTMSVCGGGGDAGPSYMCNDQQPFEQDGQLYGFVASNKACCSCYQLTFTSGQVSGQTMLVQITNHGGDLQQNHFDIAIPGGGFGIFNGCAYNSGEPVNPPAEFDTPYSNWGQRYGGVGSIQDCSNLPQQVQSGCKWRFESFKGSDNPSAHFKSIDCPNVLTKISGCKPTSFMTEERKR